MNKNLWIGAATVLVGCVGGYVFHMMSDPPVQRVTVTPRKVPVQLDGDAETSDAIEPLVVEGYGDAGYARMPIGDCEPLPRVVLSSTTQQPPRPDAIPGQTLRMPYADETEDWLGVTVDRVLRILEPGRALLDLFDPAEESESGDLLPTPLRTPDYHQQHCPRQELYRR